jgi:hypothetical protein
MCIVVIESACYLMDAIGMHNASMASRAARETDV